MRFEGDGDFGDLTLGELAELECLFGFPFELACECTAAIRRLAQLLDVEEIAELVLADLNEHVTRSFGRTLNEIDRLPEIGVTNQRRIYRRTDERRDTVKVLLKLDGRAESGGSALVMHNERLADPLDEHARGIAAVSKKRNKTEADHVEIGRLEFLGGLYTNGNGPCIPAWNILRCLQDGAKRHKRGVDVLRGVYPLTEHADVLYEGPRDPVKMWKEGGFSLRKTVGIQRSRTVRTRPIFTEWQAELAVEVDPTVFDLDTLANVWRDAGVYAGLGEMRPVYGRFKATLEDVR